jgi:glycosyltransferase involved in cell wall biosynthesis
MKQFISIIIPIYNGAGTIKHCLDSIFALNDDACEVIVVDDCSRDDSRAIVKKYPCRLVQLERHSGASGARNAGAMNSKGEALFFIDADCLLKQDTLSIVRDNLSRNKNDVVIGGTYTPVPYDPGFFSLFQSAYINYSETKKCVDPDYVATHALVIRPETFKKINGFTENFLPILEDVEFSHRLRRAGHKLVMDPDLQVRHIFRFTFLKSLRNAARKTRYWMVYSLKNRDLFADSGTASKELKINGAAWMVTVLLALVSSVSGHQVVLLPLPFLWTADIIASRYLFRAFFKAGGALFALLASLYYIMIYPAAVWFGALQGIALFSFQDTTGLRGKEAQQHTPGPGL